MCCEVRFGAGGADLGEDPAGGDVEAGDERAGAVADVLKFAPLDPAGLQGQGRGDALEGLDTGHLIDAQGGDSGGGALRGQAVGLADVMALRRELGIRLGVEPAAHAVGLEVGLFLKCARPSVAR